MSDVRLSRETVEALRGWVVAVQHRSNDTIVLHNPKSADNVLIVALAADLARAEALLSCPVVGCEDRTPHIHGSVGPHQERP